jgi:hypothetical protein
MLIGGIPKKRLVANGRADHFQNMIPFLIAGGSVVTTLIAPEPVDTINHTLLGVKVKAKEVVTRNMWGTPMMPDGKGSYSLIAPPEPVLIERSLIQPPKTSAPTFEPDKPYPLDSLTQRGAGYLGEWRFRVLRGTRSCRVSVRIFPSSRPSPGIFSGMIV